MTLCSFGRSQHRFCCFQVIGNKKPKHDREFSNSFRKRSSSIKFYSKIEQVIKEKETFEYAANSGGDDGSVNDDMPGLDDKKAETERLDLIISTADDIPSGSRIDDSEPDELSVENAVSKNPSSCDDLIDFSQDLPPFGKQDKGDRDSAISTMSSSSLRVSSFSSSGSSGPEFPKDTNSVARTHGNIKEEDSGFDISCPGYLDEPDGFRQRCSFITDDEKRKSVMTRRESSSSGTITGAGENESNRDSQASFLNFEGEEFLVRSGSSSTADDEREIGQLERKTSRTESLKRRLKGGGKKIKEKGKNDVPEERKKKDKGLFAKMRGRSNKKVSKASGARVCAALTEKSLEAFDISNRLTHPEVEVGTAKGL